MNNLEKNVKTNEMEKNMEMEIFDKIIKKSEIFTKFKVF
jgi:hypothetical protein